MFTLIMTVFFKVKPLSASSQRKLNSFDFKNIPQDLTKRIKAEPLQDNGIVEYQNLKGYKTDGVQVLSHDYVSPQRLKLERYGRIGATASSVVLNLLSALGLFYSGGKLLFNSLSGHGTDDSYKSLGRAYSASAVAGALTGAAHESPEWAVGNVGMGVFSRYLEKIWGLAGFSISEGLASIGMGSVRYRDEENVSAVRNSIFNNPKLSYLRFLMPIEQSVIKFARRFISLDGWKRFMSEEPYSLFQTAGGGLISAGGVLTLASLFKKKMSDRLQSFFYLPYSAFSISNLIAFFRDGDVLLKRAKDFGSRKKGEFFSMKAEGHCKRIASPFLALNNLFLGLKGLGIDTQGGLMYNLAMSFRAWGAGIAFLSFKAQSLLKFFKPDLFGPYFKEAVKIILNPVKEGKRVFNFMKNVTSKRPDMDIDSGLKSIIFNSENKLSGFMQELINTKTFQSLKGKTQIGLQTPNQPNGKGRFYINRYIHSMQVCGVGLLIFNELLKNTKDPELRKLLTDNEEAFKLSPLLHDIGHIARSHTAERAVKGHNNDEETVNILNDENSDICQIFYKHYGRAKGIEVLKQVRDIIGRWSPLYKAFKLSDYTEYTRFGDFAFIDGFPKWNIDELKDFADNIRLCRGKDGKIITGFTPKGALDTFKLLFDRKVFNDSFNYNPLSFVEEYPYLLGLDASDITATKIKTMTEPEVDNAVNEGLDKLKNANFQFRVKHVTGGENAYTGYSRVNPEKKILVIPDENSEPVEFLTYLNNVIRLKDPDTYNELQPLVKGLTTPKEFDLTILVRSNS